MEEIILCVDCNINEEKKVVKKYSQKKCVHNIQKRYCKECGGSEICIHSKRKIYCEDCHGSGICEHKKRKYNCKECSNALCSHNKNKHHCKDCGGSAFCEHKKQKSRCKECNGVGICIHKKEKSRCKECNGSEICVHGKHKYYCKDCCGSAYCEHGKLKSYCKDCDGSAYCKHNKDKYSCFECNGSKICEHGKNKHHCKECNGSQICKHNKGKNHCKECNGSQICKHNKEKNRCKECGGSALCKSTWCEKTANKKYEGYCLFCYVNLFPDKPITRNYKTKEKDVVDRILKIFPNFTWICDKKVQDGCSKRRPDLLLDMGSHIIIVEIDENAHTDYDCSCENKRLMEISQDLGHRPIVFIRFNPDDYVDKKGNKIKSCWKLNRTTGLIVIDQKKIKEWDERINSLVEQINYWIKNPTEKTIEIVELFY